MFSELDLAVELFPPIRASYDIVGELRSSIARRIGLKGPVPVVLGGADSLACAFGAGVVKPGPVSEMAGSSTCLNTAVATPLDDLRISNCTGVLPDGFMTETGINTTGEAVRWAAELLYGGRAGQPLARDFAQLDAEASVAPPGADDVLAIVALADGERDNPELRGAFTGLSLRHGRGVLARAVLEGAAFAIRDQLDLLRNAGAPVDELRISGGDARLTAWNRIKADVTGLPVLTVPGDATTIGVAMLAGIGAGVYLDAGEAMRRAVRYTERLAPEAAPKRLYDARYGAWRRLARSSVVRRHTH
jgi:xylulokinase